MRPNGSFRTDGRLGRDFLTGQLPTCGLVKRHISGRTNLRPQPLVGFVHCELGCWGKAKVETLKASLRVDLDGVSPLCIPELSHGLS